MTTGLSDRASLSVDEVNGEPALLVQIGAAPGGVYVLSIADGRISGLRIVRNPDKLSSITQQLARSVL